MPTHKSPPTPPDTAAAPADRPVTDEANDAALRRSADSSTPAIIVSLIFWGGIASIFITVKFPGVWTYLINHWRLATIPVAAVVLLACVPYFRRASATMRTGLTVFILVPFVLSVIAWATIQDETGGIGIMRYVFCGIACLFPAVVYYLFIATRKIGLLNEYFSNVRRLGLLSARTYLPPDEREQEYRVRLVNYIQEFESLYGPLPERLVAEMIAAKDPLGVLAEHAAQRPGTWGIAKVFTADVAVPIVGATALIEIGWLLILFGPGSEGSSLDFFNAGRLPSTYAFLGAYFFSLQFLFRRFVRGDLRKGAYVAVSLRIILAIIGTVAAVAAYSVITDNTSLRPDGTSSAQLGVCVLAFVIGVFPRVAWQFVQGAWKALMGKIGAAGILPSLHTALPVSDLDGLTVWHEARLEEEDVENIPNMASCDILGLMVSTKIAPERLVGWVDQAILFQHLGSGEAAVESRAKLRACGIFTATALLMALQNATARQKGPDVEKSLSEAAGRNVRVLVDAMSTNSNLEQICAWRGMVPEGQTPTSRPAFPAKVIELKPEVPVPSLTASVAPGS